MAKVNLGRVRYPIENVVNPNSCWPVSGAAVAQLVETTYNKLLTAIETMGGLTSNRQGWYIKTIDDSRWDYDRNTGTIDLYVGTSQACLSDISNPNGSAASAFIDTFDTGWANYTKTPEYTGDLVVIRNGDTFCECGYLEAVRGNKITIRGVGIPVLNGAFLPGTSIRAKVFYVQEYQDKDAEGLPPGGDEWTVALARASDYVIGESTIHNIGEIKASSGGYAFGDDAAAYGTDAVAIGISAIANGYGSIAIGNGVYNPLNGTTIVGRWNALPALGTSYPFAVGIGTGYDNRRDGFRVNNDGSVYIEAIKSLPQFKRNDTSAQLAVKLAALTARLCANPDGSSATGSGSSSGGGTLDGSYPASVFSPGLGPDEDINKIIYANDILVAATDAGIYYSVDGDHFQRAVDTGIWCDIVWDDFHKTFIVSGNLGIRYSSDGRTWTMAKAKNASGALVDANTIEGKLRAQAILGTIYVFCGGRCSTDGGKTWSYSVYIDEPGAFWTYAGGSVNHFELVRGIGAVTMYDQDHRSAFPAEDIGHGYTYIGAPSMLRPGSTAAKNLLIAISTDPTVPVVYTDASIGPTKWKTCNAPRASFTSVKIYENGGKGTFMVILTTVDRGVYLAEEFKGADTEWLHVPNMATGNYCTPSDIIRIGDADLVFDTAYGSKDNLLVNACGKYWARVPNFSLVAEAPILAFGNKLAFISNFKEVIVVPIDDIKDDIMSAAVKACKDSTTASSRYITELDGDKDGMVAILEKCNEAVSRINIFTDILGL